MAFEQKRMNEADMALYASWGIRNPLTAAMMHSGEWTVDAENNIYLVSFGGRGEMPEDSDYPPDYFLLRYKGLNVFFEGRMTSETIIENERWKNNWNFDIHIPKTLENEVNRLFSLIEEALLCQKVALRPGLINKIVMHIVADNIKFVA